MANARRGVAKDFWKTMYHDRCISLIRRGTDQHLPDVQSGVSRIARRLQLTSPQLSSMQSREEMKRLKIPPMSLSDITNWYRIPRVRSRQDGLFRAHMHPSWTTGRPTQLQNVSHKTTTHTPGHRPRRPYSPSHMQVPASRHMHPLSGCHLYSCQ